MSLSPLHEDPYLTLGVTKDADLGQIRIAHRKLVLKYHPDRIRGDDVEEKNKAKNEFQKVQQAYEILADSSKRSRYDDQCRLAELQKERMSMREAARPSGHARSASGPTSIRREMRSDGVFYEERAPPTSYFDSRDRFDEPISRSSARKHEAPYEKERKPSVAKPAERKTSRIVNPVEGISMKTALNLKASAARAKEKARESHAKSQEVRDREKRRERSDKQSGRRAYTAEVESETDSDTIGPRRSPRSRRSSPRPRQEPEQVRSRPSPIRRVSYEHDDESFDESEKWERHHKASRDYIAESQKRPSLPRGGSDAHVYWGAGDYPSGRRSGSDSEKRPSSSRRTAADESRTRPPMPMHNSAPSNLKPHVEDRIPQRAQTNPYPEREHRAAPSLGRSQTMPLHRSKKDNAPRQPSNLKQEVQPQDSGYYSSSNPHTPEMKGESPPPSRKNSKRTEPTKNRTKYEIVQPDSDDDRASHIRILDSDDETRHRRYRSPEPDRRERERERESYRDRERERPIDRERDRVEHVRPRERERPLRTESDNRTTTRSTRPTAPTSFPRESFRHDVPSTRGSPPVSRQKLFGEVSSDEKEGIYTYPYDASRVKTTAYRPATTAGYGNPRFREAEEDYAPGSTFRDSMRHPQMRRPSAAY